MANSLKNIILDLGGVLLDIDYQKTADAFTALGYTHFSDMYSQFTADDLFADLERGMIREEDFYERMRKAGNSDVSRYEMESAWNRMLLSWRQSSLDFLPALSKQYRLFLLSNTNEIHLAAFNKILNEETGRESIDDLFEKAYWSHLVNLRKPNADIFEFVVSDAGIIPGETLFIDDSENNIETAARLGFQTYLLINGERIEELDYNAF